MQISVSPPPLKQAPQQLADVAREAGLDTIRYESVHDPAHDSAWVSIAAHWCRPAHRPPPLGALISRRNHAPSMPEMPHAGEHHREPRRIGGSDDLGIAQRTTGLDHRGGAGFRRL